MARLGHWKGQTRGLAPAFKHGRVWAELPKGSDSPLGLLEWAAEGEPGLACLLCRARNA